MHIVHYTKHFITGNLKGLAVPCSLREPDAAHALRLLESLARFTPASPGRDAVTGAKFWVQL